MKQLLLPTLLLSTLGFAQPTGKPAVIQGSGCVSRAVESNCLVLKDFKTGETYNLMFGENSPPPGTPLRFQGAEHQGMTTCMQGEGRQRD
jgi:hypothetical protein